MKIVGYSLVLALVFASCSRDDDPTPDPTPTKGIISGEVNLYLEGPQPADDDGMTVSITGTNFTTTTDIDGKYEFTDVPFGSVDLVFEKSGYGTFKRFGIDHSAAVTFISPNPSLSQLSTTSITNLSTSVVDTVVTVATTMNPSASNGNPRYLTYFFSSSSTVSNNEWSNVLGVIEAKIAPYNLNLRKSALETMGFQSGQTVYVRCYGNSYWTNEYEDPNLGMTVYPNLNQMTVAAASFVVP